MILLHSSRFTHFRRAHLKDNMVLRDPLLVDLGSFVYILTGDRYQISADSNRISVIGYQFGRDGGIGRRTRFRT